MDYGSAEIRASRTEDVVEDPGDAGPVGQAAARNRDDRMFGGAIPEVVTDHPDGRRSPVSVEPGIEWVGE